MKLEPLDDADELEAAPEPPRPPATLAPDESPDDDEDDDDDEPPPDSVVPTAPFTAVTVPDMGARSVVAASAFSALVTLSWALSRLACAAATVMVLVAPPEPDPEPDAELSPAPCDPFDCAVVAVGALAAVSAASRASCADCRLASACARSTLAASGSTLARISSSETC